MRGVKYKFYASPLFLFNFLSAPASECAVQIQNRNCKMPNVYVRYHAILREKIGCPGERYELSPAEMNVNGVLHALSEKYTFLIKPLPALQIAVNETIVSAGAAIQENDTIDLLPPFGGG